MDDTHNHPHTIGEEIRHLLVTDHRVAWTVAVALWTVALSLFILIAVPETREALDDFDLAVYEVVFPFKVGLLTFLARALDLLGGVIFVWSVRALVTVWLVVRRRWAALTVWWIAIVLSEPAVGILKAAYDRPRPPVSLVETFTASFPSGHAVAGAVVAISLVVVFVPAGPRRRNLEILAAAFALLMAGSRVYLGAHWLTDVVAGVAFGAACAIGAAAAVHWWTEYRGPAASRQMGEVSSIT
jgi:undecaprenyl-diphosphatase